MHVRSTYLSIRIVFLSGCLIGIVGLVEPAFSASEPSPADQGTPGVTPESSNDAGKAREGKGRHPMRKACAEDVKKLCADVKVGEGRVVQCLKQHAQELTPGCSDVMQQRGKHRQ